MSGTDAAQTAAKVPLAVYFFSAVCIGGSAFAYFFEQCDACQWATSMLGGINLGLAGLLFYPVLLGLAILRKRSLLAWGFAFATGVHLALVSALIYSHTMCPPCCITATSAFLAMASLIPKTLKQIVPMVSAIAVIFILSGLGLLYLEHRADQMTDEAWVKAIACVESDTKSKPVPKGRARIVYFVRKDCHFCAEFKEGVLKKVVTEFSAILDTEPREAFENLPTPMVFVAGVQNAIFKDAPTSEELRKAILKAKGE